MSLISGPIGPPVPRREIIKLLERLRMTLNLTIDRLIVLVEEKPRARRRARRGKR